MQKTSSIERKIETSESAMDRNFWENHYKPENAHHLHEDLEKLIPFDAFATLPTQRYYHHTPLVRLKRMSELMKRPVYLKDESQQVGGSFKFRGVFYQVYKALHRLVVDYISDCPQKRENARRVFARGVKIVTQSTGNHGINTINSTLWAREALKKEFRNALELDPRLGEFLDAVRPIIFTSKKISPVKKQGMLEAIKVQDLKPEDVLTDNYGSYEEALMARRKLIAESEGSAFYMEHAGFDIMLGHGSMALEIHREIKGRDHGNKVGMVFPVGAGGPLGIAMHYKYLNPEIKNYMVQAPQYESFVRILQELQVLEKNGNHINQEKLEEILEAHKNPRGLKPTLELSKHPIYFPDGIAVDTPELFSVPVAQKSLDGAMIVNDVQAFEEAALLLYADLSDHYREQGKSPQDIKVGGTTALAAQALLDRLKASHGQFAEDHDAFVIVGTEGTIMPHITDYQIHNQNKVSGLMEHYSV